MQLNNDEGNIGIITAEREQEIEKEQLTKYQLLIQLKTLYKITDKLEQRISKLEKVLESHAKCIGELRGNELNFVRVQSAINIKLKTG